MNKAQLVEEVAGRVKTAIEAVNFFPNGPQGELWEALAGIAHENPEGAQVGSVLMDDAVKKMLAGIKQLIVGFAMFGVHVDVGDGESVDLRKRLGKFFGGGE